MTEQINIRMREALERITLLSASQFPSFNDMAYECVSIARAALAEAAAPEAPAPAAPRTMIEDFIVGLANEAIKTPDASIHELLGALGYIRETNTSPAVEKPVAWYFESRHIDSAWRSSVSLTYPGAEGPYLRNVRPLAFADHPPTQREPLTEEQIAALCEAHAGSVELTDDEAESMRAFVRSIERAHEIGGDE